MIALMEKEEKKELLSDFRLILRSEIYGIESILNTRINNLGVKIDSIGNNLNEKIDKLGIRVELVETNLNAKIGILAEDMDTKFAKVTEAFQVVYKKQDEMQAILDVHTKAIDILGMEVYIMKKDIKEVKENLHGKANKSALVLSKQALG